MFLCKRIPPLEVCVFKDSKSDREERWTSFTAYTKSLFTSGEGDEWLARERRNLSVNWRLKFAVLQKAAKYFSSPLGYPSSLE